ncbi:hypothetical protein Nepgr_030871 [Nepenthes gracilis]|uniref:Uncharacterized protein n=1 Tax=Nepenthes gracilis TaxID=150966 RepID=A0AAD3TFK5_NEPGR|nr:hypothetical protein Nepgr_030871 [Nepenthes gracilis]
MKDRTSFRRQSLGNSYQFPVGNNPSFSLSLFLPINREGSGHENASAGIEQNVRTSEDERENAPRVSPFISAYSCRLDVGHEIHHYTEQITGIHISVKQNCARFTRESPSARYGIQGLNPGINLSS